MRHAGKARDAYEAHKGPKVLIRYEELRDDTLGTMERLYSTLGIEVRREELARAVERHAWENIPRREGTGEVLPQGEAGGWREDLTPAR